MFEKFTDPRRSIAHDDRAVSEVIGAILIFGLLILLLVLIQANAVPAANKQVELEHNQRVTQDFQSLQEELYRVGTTGSDGAVTFESGVSYPPRFFLLNPGPSIGLIRTTPETNFVIQNAYADGETRDYWGGGDTTFLTRGIAYKPNYNELPNPGTLSWAHSLLYTSYDNGALTFEDPTGFIDGNRVQLTLVEGQLSRGAISTSVGLATVSARERTISISDDPTDPNDNIQFVLQSEIPDSTWQSEILDGEPANVVNPDDSDDTVTIELDPGTYELSIAKVRLGTTQSPTPPGPAYITDVGSTSRSVPEGATQRFTVEVRDEYNNPVSGEQVYISDLSGQPGSVTPVGSTVTNQDGQVTVEYTAPANGPANVNLDVWYGSATEPTQIQGNPQVAEFDLEVLDSDGSGTNSDQDGVSSINPDVNTVRLIDAGTTPPSAIVPSNKNNVVGSLNSDFYLTFKNVAGESREFQQIRLLFHDPNGGTIEDFSVEQFTSFNQAGDVVWNDVINPSTIEIYSEYVPMAPDQSQSITVGNNDEITIGFDYTGTNIQNDIVGFSIIYSGNNKANYFVLIP